MTRLLSRVALVVSCLVGWQLAAQAAANPYFPPPLEILDAARQLWLSGPPSRLFLSDAIATDILPSLARLLAGWACAVVIGVALGVAIGRSAVVADYLGLVLSVARAIPPPLLVPVFLVVFGIGYQMEVAAVIFGAVWPVLLNTIDGARSIDTTLIHTARVFGVGRGRWLLGVVLPAAAPKIFAGLRVSLSIALILMVVSELVGSTSGIGYQLVSAQGDFDLPDAWAWILLISLLGYTLNRMLVAAQGRLLAWHQGG
ncbi:ABC transporter permease [Kutzneria sp. NPDC052558]|uniref:ABC transporter permease n=1 Tax=Kutzneria sp. NPDC052558 TaxID=3364121 RepID=UPI0037C86E92